MAMEYDVAVVGAGPAGSVAAREIAAAGLRVVVVEEHPQVGRPVHCAGLVTARTLEAAGVSEKDLVLNQIRGAIVHTPAGNQVAVGGDKTHALVIDRPLLDQRLAERAQEAGATLMLERRVTGVERTDRGMRLEMARGRARSVLEASLVVGADGARSLVARCTGTAAPEESIVATGGEISGGALTSDMVEVFVHPDLAPGWFGWLIPVGDGVARVGTGSAVGGASPRRLLDGLMDRHAHLRSARYLRLQGGVIPVAPVRQVASPGVMLVGDAAGQVKPTSGGGIYTSILAGKLCARVAAEALRRGDMGNSALSAYGDLWMEQVGADLLMGAALRRLLTRLTPMEVEACLQLFTLEEVRAAALEYGDLDFPTRLFSHLFRPRIVWRGLRALPVRVWPRMAWLLARWYVGTGGGAPGLAGPPRPGR